MMYGVYLRFADSTNGVEGNLAVTIGRWRESRIGGDLLS